MNLFKTRADADHEDGETDNGSSRFLDYEMEPKDFYAEYVNDGHNDKYNLFADSYIMDRYWLEVARAHIRDYASAVRLRSELSPQRF